MRTEIRDHGALRDLAEAMGVLPHWHDLAGAEESGVGRIGAASSDVHFSRPEKSDYAALIRPTDCWLRALDTARAETLGAVHRDLRQDIALQSIVAFEVGAVT